ncbi:MAG: sulfatase-like hydrolase/transferase [Planctomycetota bacterium]|jgi:N-sulfoglucosamine sulfohydrolase
MKPEKNDLRRKTKSFLCVVAIGGLLAPGAGAAEGLPGSVVYQTGDPYGYRIPSLVTTQRGTLLAFAERRVGLHDHAKNDIVLRRSTNLGDTWSPVQVIADEGGDSLNDLCAVVLDSGRVLLMYQRYPEGVHSRSSGHTVIAEPGFGGAKNVRAYLTHSDDDGLTWSEPREITRDARPEGAISIGSPGVGIQLTRGRHAGRVLLPVYETYHVGNNQREWTNSVLISDDRGETWRRGRSVAMNRAAPGFGNEAQVVELSDGSVLMSARNQGGAAGRKMAVSRDGGETWGPYAERDDLLTPACMSSVIRYRWPRGDAPGVLLHSLPNTEKSRSKGTIFLSRDDGATWPISRLLEPEGFAYSVLTKLPNGQIGCLYEGSGYKTIRFVRFSLDWVMGREAGVAGASATAAAPKKDIRPNILLITSEDNGPELGCYGDPYVRTPRLDQLAAEGVRFVNAYVTYSVCSPSRASILTGLYPHQNGQVGLATHKFAMYEKFENIYTLLKDAGYRTGMLGKLHVNPESAFPMDFRAITGSNFNNRPVHRYAEEAGKFFDAGSDPFFLMVNYPDAHFPLLTQQYGVPADPLRGEDVVTLPWIGADSPRLRQFTADYYNCLERLDTGVGALLDRLAESGKADNTLVIYLGDHGAQFSRGKTSVYEAGLRIPLIVRWPGNARAGLAPEELVSTIDLLPTMLGAAGVKTPRDRPGHALQPLLAGRAAPDWPKHVYGVTTGSSPNLYYPQFSVRNERYKLIVSPVRDRENTCARSYIDQLNAFFKAGTTEQEMQASPKHIARAYAVYLNPPLLELYDLKNDPYEWRNLADDPKHASALAELRGRLENWRAETRDPFADEGLLRRFTEEHDAAMKMNYRGDKTFRWQYLDYFERYMR